MIQSIIIDILAPFDCLALAEGPNQDAAAIDAMLQIAIPRGFQRFFGQNSIVSRLQLSGRRSSTQASSDLSAPVKIASPVKPMRIPNAFLMIPIRPSTVPRKRVNPLREA